MSRPTSSRFPPPAGRKIGPWSGCRSLQRRHVDHESRCSPMRWTARAPRLMLGDRFASIDMTRPIKSVEPDASIADKGSTAASSSPISTDAAQRSSSCNSRGAPSGIARDAETHGERCLNGNFFCKLAEFKRFTLRARSADGSFEPLHIRRRNRSTVSSHSPETGTEHRRACSEALGPTTSRCAANRHRHAPSLRWFAFPVNG